MTERWDDERLDRLAVTSAANTEAIKELRSGINSLLTIGQIHQQSLDISQRQFEVLVQEIRGIRSENRRILAHLFGEQHES